MLRGAVRTSKAALSSALQGARQQSSKTGQRAASVAAFQKTEYARQHYAAGFLGALACGSAATAVVSCADDDNLPAQNAKIWQALSHTASALQALSGGDVGGVHSTAVAGSVTASSGDGKGSLTLARLDRLKSIFPEGKVPLLWCPVLAHYKDDGTLDTRRMHLHQRWLVEQGVTGFLVPGSTGDVWDMTISEAVDFLDVCLRIAGDIRADLRCGKAPFILAGALQADEAGTLEVMQKMRSKAGDGIFGFCVCPPRGIEDEARMENSLSKYLDVGVPIAVYQLPQVTQVTMPVAVLRRLADKYENFLFFKDSSGKDATALSGVGLDGVFMVRGAEGKYAEWLSNPIPSGYHGFLLSTANVYPAQLGKIIGSIADVVDGDFLTAALLSGTVSRATAAAFGAVTAAGVGEALGGNAFTNSAKAVDHWMAWGPTALEQPLPRLKSGKRLPADVVRSVGEALKSEGLMPSRGYLQ